MTSMVKRALVRLDDRRLWTANRTALARVVGAELGLEGRGWVHDRNGRIVAQSWADFGRWLESAGVLARGSVAIQWGALRSNPFEHEAR